MKKNASKNKTESGSNAPVISSITIQSGIPIPSRPGVWKGQLSKLNVGDSFEVAKAVLPASNAYGVAKKLGIKLTSRSEPNGKIRYWRIENPEQPVVAVVSSVTTPATPEVATV